MLREILPNILSPVIVVADDPHGARDHPRGEPVLPRPRRAAADASWGSMVADGRSFILDAWWVSTFPGLAILLLVLAINVASQALRDAFDPTPAGLTGPPPRDRDRGAPRVPYPRQVRAVDGVDLAIARRRMPRHGRRVRLGQERHVASVMGLVRPPGRIDGGRIRSTDGNSPRSTSARCARCVAGRSR